MEKPDTLAGLREILTEMFGEERINALSDDAKPWHDAIAAKSIDIIDFKCFVQEKFGVWIVFLDESLADIAKHIDAITPSTNPY
jgi:acyl carrier protein